MLKESPQKGTDTGNRRRFQSIEICTTETWDIDFISASIEELKENEIRYEEIDRNMIAERLLIINATPLGTYPKRETFPPIPYEFLTDSHLLFDLVYNPEVTHFMKKGKAKGATVKNGYEMLLRQALKIIRNLEKSI